MSVEVSLGAKILCREDFLVRLPDGVTRRPNYSFSFKKIQLQSIVGAIGYRGNTPRLILAQVESMFFPGSYVKKTPASKNYEGYVIANLVHHSNSSVKGRARITLQKSQVVCVFEEAKCFST